MSPNRRIKPSTIIIVLECVFLLVVFVGYSLLSSREEEHPVVTEAETATPPNATPTPPSVPAIVDRPADSPEPTDPPPIDLGLRTAESSLPESSLPESSLPESSLPESSLPESTSPRPGTLKRPAEIVEAMQAPGSSRAAGLINVGPSIEFQLNAETRSRFFRDAKRPDLTSDDWWLPANSDKAFLLKTRNHLSTLYFISLDTARCTMLARFLQQPYLAARGNDSEIYLLRHDTSGKRFRLIADTFSLHTIRVTATRTLLDLPLLSTQRIDRFVWDPGLASLAMTLVDSDSGNGPVVQTHLVSLRTGQKIDAATGEHSVGNSLPLGFSPDGKRLWLASLATPNGAKTVGSHQASLVVLDLTNDRLQAFGNPELPKRIPIQISNDANWIVYLDTDQAEVWNAMTGQKQAVIPMGSAAQIPDHRPRLFFAAGNQWIVYDNGNSLTIHSTNDGTLLASFPATGDNRDNRETNWLTLFSTATSSDLLLFAMDGIDDSSTSPLGTAESGFPAPWLRRFNAPLANATLTTADEADAVQVDSQSTDFADELADKFTDWMSPREYDVMFAQLASEQKYPVTVEGRFHQGQRQYRGLFIPRPEKFEFVTHHDQHEGSINTLAQRYRQRGFSETWRQSFVDDEGTTWWSAIWTTPAAVLESAK